MRTNHLPVRDTDPQTSWSAAYSAMAETEPIQRIVIVALGRFGPMTHDQIIEKVRQIRPVSDSGVRTRVSELVEMGKVERHPSMVSKSRYGRASLLWRVVQK